MPNNQNGRKPLEAAKRMLKEKGYYIVLFLCIAAVGISGYVFIRTAISAGRTDSDTLSASDAAAGGAVLDVPLTAPTPDAGADAGAETGAEAGGPAAPVGAAGTEAPDAAAAPSEPDAAVTAMTDAEVSQAAAGTVIRPLAGATQKAHSMDALVYSETMGDWRVHNGIDIAAQAGAQVLAAKAGTVSAVYQDDFYGSTVEITHSGGCRTVYSNLTGTALVNAGDTVAAGAVIGAVGSTAIAECADAPHLHFEVWYGTEPADPEEFLS